MTTAIKMSEAAANEIKKAVTSVKKANTTTKGNTTMKKSTAKKVSSKKAAPKKVVSKKGSSKKGTAKKVVAKKIEMDPNMVTVQELAKKAKISGQKARRLLRGSKANRETGRWAFMKGSAALKVAMTTLGL